MAAADGLRGKATRLVAQPTTNSTRAWKRHLARLRQETTIKELRQLNDALELELAKWYEWWYEIPANRASPLCTKAAKIVDELAARDGYAAKARRPFSHPHQCYRWLRGCNSEEAEDYRRKVRARNEAAHASAPEFEEEFDIWALLGGMATLAPAPICGGVLLPGPPVGDFLPEGDALHNLIINKRSELEADIVRIRALFDDPTWQLYPGDIVYWNSERWPSVVIRVGWGQYERQVRIKRITEPNLWETGWWCYTDQLFKLEVNDKLEAMDTVADAFDEQRVIPVGAVCQLVRWDNDGDPVVEWNEGVYTILRHELDGFSLQ